MPRIKDHNQYRVMHKSKTKITLGGNVSCHRQYYLETLNLSSFKINFFKLIHLTTSDNDYECGEDLFYVTEFEEESIKRNKFSSKPRRL